MNKIRIVVACKSLKIQDAIRDLSVNDKFEILDFIEDETNVIETIKYTKPDLVFLEDDFENLLFLSTMWVPRDCTQVISLGSNYF